ncbi:hypothetical protein [Anatilimnocola floriformis]|uniref:hypothetical protein n=1 Tax=Anatilimnocola floriformis TaxID=2948575 RepID=UPI0020C27F80|nr:hypothetical protein [Anatilimnocola floriformis]
MPASSTDEEQWLGLVAELEARIVRHRYFEEFEELESASFVERDDFLSERGLPWDYCSWRPVDLEDQDFDDVTDEIARLIEGDSEDELVPEFSAPDNLS